MEALVPLLVRYCPTDPFVVGNLSPPTVVGVDNVVPRPTVSAPVDALSEMSEFELDKEATTEDQVDALVPLLVRYWPEDPLVLGKTRPRAVVRACHVG